MTCKNARMALSTCAVLLASLHSMPGAAGLRAGGGGGIPQVLGFALGRTPVQTPSLRGASTRFLCLGAQRKRPALWQRSLALVNSHEGEGLEAFAAWFQAAGGEGLGDAVEVRETANGGGRGLFARRAIAPGEEILWLPPSLTLSEETGWASDPEAGLLQACLRALEPLYGFSAELPRGDPLLAVLLLLEHARASRSPLASYLRVLPPPPPHVTPPSRPGVVTPPSSPEVTSPSSPEVTGTAKAGGGATSDGGSREDGGEGGAGGRPEGPAWMWAEEDARRMLDAGVAQVAVDTAARVAEEHTLLLQGLSTLSTQAGDAGSDLAALILPDFSLANYRWAQGTVMSRAYAVDYSLSPSPADDASGLEGLTVLLPAIDMANHQQGVEYSVRAARGGVSFSADRSYAPGQEVMSSYGEKAPDDLLVFFGFRPPE